MLGLRTSFRHLIPVLLAATLAACGGGGNSEPSGAVVSGSGTPGNNLPVTVLELSSNARFIDEVLHVHVGTLLVVDAAGSSDADGDPLSFKWQLISTPDGSAAQIYSSGSKSYFTPDAKGTYRFAVTVSDNKGGSVSQVVEFIADNTPPEAVTVIQVNPVNTATQELSRTASLGSMVSFDASGSKDADLDTLTTTWSMVERPVGSKAILAVSVGAASRFQPDSMGTYKIRSVTKDSKGAESITDITILVNNRAPEGLMTIYAAPTATQSTSSFTTSEGYQIVLNGGPSFDGDGDPLTYSWQLLEKPASSAMGVDSANQSTLAIIPDVKGTYKLKLTVTDSAGAKGENVLTLLVNNKRPVANISTNATPIAQASAPVSRIPSGVEVLLRGSDSVDPDGETLTYFWDIVSRPEGSLAGLSAYDTANVRFTPDRDGSYRFRLRVTDPKDAYSERDVEIVVGGATPVVTFDRQRAMATLGETISLTTTHSFGSSKELTYNWAIDTKPQGSTLLIPVQGSDKLSFKPDVVGTYIVSVNVSNGSRSASSSAIVVVDNNWAGVHNLTFRPKDAVYNRVQDLLILSSSTPQALHVVDPISKSSNTVDLPKSINAFAVSPDGLHAAVAHDALVSYVDLRKGALIRTVAVSKSASAVFLTNDGIAYLAGNQDGGGSWDSTVVVDLPNAKILNDMASSVYWAYNSFYGYLTGVMADKKNRMFFMEQGLSPSDIDYLEFDPVNHNYVKGGDSPYHGDYSMGATLWLNEDQSIIFNSAGTMFNTDTLAYAGTIDDLVNATSFSQSKVANEIIATVKTYDPADYYGYTLYLQSSYRRFVGSYYSRVDDVALPLVDGKQSYAVKVFHSSMGRHVVLVQVGSNVPEAAASTFHVIYR